MQAIAAALAKDFEGELGDGWAEALSDSRAEGRDLVFQHNAQARRKGA